MRTSVVEPWESYVFLLPLILIAYDEPLNQSVKCSQTQRQVCSFLSRFFKTCLLGRDFPHRYKECFVLLPQPMGELTIHPPSAPSVLTSTPPHVYPLQGTASSLAHHPVFALISFVTVQAHYQQIVLFWLSHSNFPSKFLLGRDFHTVIKRCFVLLPDQRGISHKHYETFTIKPNHINTIITIQF